MREYSTLFGWGFKSLSSEKQRARFGGELYTRLTQLAKEPGNDDQIMELMTQMSAALGNGVSSGLARFLSVVHLNYEGAGDRDGQLEKMRLYEPRGAQSVAGMRARPAAHDSKMAIRQFQQHLLGHHG